MTPQETSRVPHVVIVGGGFGGLTLAKALRHAPVQVTLLDRTNHHLFQPLLYQVATAGLSPADIASPIRSILRGQRNTRVLMEDVISVDIKDKYIKAQNDLIPYDYLVLAMGAQTSYFGHEATWGAHAIGLKNLEDALQIRRQVLQAFEQAEYETDPEKRKTLLTFVVIGGGPTGVELAGALCELSRHVLARDFRLLDPTQARVVLIEAGPRILPSFHEKLSMEAQKRLQKLGCEVLINTKVSDVTESGVHMGNQFLASTCILWGAGVKATPLSSSLGLPVDKAGRLLVEPDLTLPGCPYVFAIGDTCAFLHQTGQPLPGTSPVAMQQARTVAKSIVNMIRNKPRIKFHFFDKGSMATIGRGTAIAETGKLRLKGFVAWLAWLLVHIFFLIGFRNRFLVLFQWAWSYLTYQRGARLITNQALPST